MRKLVLGALLVAVGILVWSEQVRGDVAVARRDDAYVDLLTAPVSMTVITQAAGQVAPVYVNRSGAPVIVTLTYGTFPHHGIGSVGLSVADHIRLFRNVATNEVASNMPAGGVASGGSAASIELSPNETLLGQCTTATWSFTLTSVKLVRR